MTHPNPRKWAGNLVYGVSGTPWKQLNTVDLFYPTSSASKRFYMVSYLRSLVWKERFLVCNTYRKSIQKVTPNSEWTASVSQCRLHLAFLIDTLQGNWPVAQIGKAVSPGSWLAVPLTLSLILWPSVCSSTEGWWCCCGIVVVPHRKWRNTDLLVVFLIASTKHLTRRK